MIAPPVPTKIVYVKEVNKVGDVIYFKFRPNGKREVYSRQLGWIDNGLVDGFAWRDEKDRGSEWTDSYVDEEEVFGWIISNGG